jgi:microcystin degradation protein MlrC
MWSRGIIKMRLIIGGFSNECNSFNNNRNEIEDARDLLYGEDIINYHKDIRTHIGGFINVALKAGIKILPTITVSFPHWIITKEAYEYYKEKLLDSIKETGKMDGVLLALHGSMIAEGVTNGDGEGEILRSVREVVGENVPIMNTYDLHSTITKFKIENSDAIFGYDTNPHVDQYERGVEAAENIIRTIKGKIKPTMAMHKPDMIVPGVGCSTWSARGNILPNVPHLWDPVKMDAADRILPLAILFKLARLIEKDEKVLNVSVSGGFPFSDVPESGPSVTVVTDNNLSLAEELSEKASELMWNMRRLFLRDLVPVDEAVDRAMKLEGPTILTDIADDPGGGGVGDSTGLLQSLVNKKAKNATIFIKDPEVIKISSRIGIGETYDFRIGGKSDERCGKPVEIKGKVMTISQGKFIAASPMRLGREMDVGKLAVIRSNGIDIVVSEERVAPNDANIFRSVGIEPASKKILVIKSTQHYRASFEPLVKNIIPVDAPGISPGNLNRIKGWYKNIRRPIFPLDNI